MHMELQELTTLQHFLGHTLCPSLALGLPHRQAGAIGEETCWKAWPPCAGCCAPHPSRQLPKLVAPPQQHTLPPEHVLQNMLGWMGGVLPTCTCCKCNAAGPQQRRAGEATLWLCSFPSRVPWVWNFAHSFSMIQPFPHLKSLRSSASPFYPGISFVLFH